MLHFIALRESGHLRMWNICSADKTLYGDRSGEVEFLLHLEKNNKSCQIILRLNTSTCIHVKLVVCVIESSLCHTLPAK